MSFNAIYETSASSMNAQTIRMNAISSNLANVDSISGSREGAYKPLQVIFSAEYNRVASEESVASVPVRVADVVEVDSLVEARYEPNNPLSDDSGYVYHSGINVVNEMADMMSATRSFEASAEVFNSVKTMQQSLLRVWEL